MKSSGKRYERGYEAGYKCGYPVGRQQGITSFFQYFQGISIILSVSNQAEPLRRCLDSVLAHTPESSEIIVIDHGSKDGTEQYLSTLTGKVTVKRFDQPLSYAAAVNQGLRLSRGDYLLVLDANAVAEEGWLPNMLSGYQENWDAGRYKPAELRLMMSKEVFRRLGYMDEESDERQRAVNEYGHRAQLLGLRVDIHEEVSDAYDGKWGTPEDLLKELQTAGHKTVSLNDFYPSHVVVRGCGDTRYWIENGLRHPIASGEDLPAVRLSQVELKSWKAGSMLEKDDFLKKASTLSSVPSSYGPIAEGVLVRDGKGTIYQSLKGKLRRFIGNRTQDGWGLAKRPVYAISDDVFKHYTAGVPVVAAPAIRSDNL